MEIVEWLQQLGLERYEEAFRGNEITAAVLPELRIPVTTNESDYARASCGDVTRGGWIPGMALRRYAGRYDRHARDSAKVGVGRLEAR